MGYGYLTGTHTIYRYGYFNGYDLTGLEDVLYHVLRPENRKTGKSRSLRIFVWVIPHGIRTLLGSRKSELATQCAFEKGAVFGQKALQNGPFFKCTARSEFGDARGQRAGYDTAKGC